MFHYSAVMQWFSRGQCCPELFEIFRRGWGGRWHCRLVLNFVNAPALDAKEDINLKPKLILSFCVL